MHNGHTQQKTNYVYLILSVCIFVCALPLLASAQNALPIASTLTVKGDATQMGTLVVFDEVSQTYAVSSAQNDARVYGVVAERPALLFTTASGSVPVQTEGIAYVRVAGSSTPITRGDLLVTGTKEGTASRAYPQDEHVFAVALESYESRDDGLLLSDVRVARARAARQEAVAQQVERQKLPVSWLRGAIAATIAMSAIIFMLFSFRSIVNNGVVSVGRNPRAQTSIITFAFGTILGVVLLGGLALFVAIAVLVLPV
jgi:hypothetical protein